MLFSYSEMTLDKNIWRISHISSRVITNTVHNLILWYIFMACLVLSSSHKFIQNVIFLLIHVWYIQKYFEFNNIHHMFMNVSSLCKFRLTKQLCISLLRGTRTRFELKYFKIHFFNFIAYND